MRNLLFTIMNILFPIECVSCGTKGPDICSACISQTLLPKAQNYPWITSFGNYHDPIIKDIMWHIKKQPNGRAAKILASAFGEMVKNRPEDASSWILVPIPISTQRFRERGYNQAELLAKYLGETFELNVINDLLVKKKHTNKQGTSKTKEERAHNILGSFGVKKKYQGIIANKNIILIDDITTTGSTLIEARDILLNTKTTRVIAWTIAN